jgi:hypothetical protein
VCRDELDVFFRAWYVTSRAFNFALTEPSHRSLLVAGYMMLCSKVIGIKRIVVYTDETIKHNSGIRVSGEGKQVCMDKGTDMQHGDTGSD